MSARLTTCRWGWGPLTLHRRSRRSFSVLSGRRWWEGKCVRVLAEDLCKWQNTVREGRTSKGELNRQNAEWTRGPRCVEQQSEWVTLATWKNRDPGQVGRCLTDWWGGLTLWGGHHIQDEAVRAGELEDQKRKFKWGGFQGPETSQGYTHPQGCWRLSRPQKLGWKLKQVKFVSRDSIFVQ